MNYFSEHNDGMLVSLSLLGNHDAFAELVLRHQKSVLGTAFKVTNNAYSAEDASQDAFLAAWMHLDLLRDGDMFGPWVCSIAKNCAASLCRHYRDAIGDISFELIENADLSDLDGIPEKLISDEQSDDLRTAVDALSENIRRVITMHYFDGLSVKQIASKLSVPEGTVKWRLSQGRIMLRKGYGIMEKEHDENESLLSRVMKQIEHLSLWRLKLNKSGFEEEYAATMELWDKLPDDDRKQYAAADMLLMGFWWIPGKRNQETLQQIERAAEESKNDAAMQEALIRELLHTKGEERISKFRERLPRLEELGLSLSIGLAHYYIGDALQKLGRLDEALAEYDTVMSVLSKSDIYYAMAMAAKRSVAWYKGISESKDIFHACHRNIGLEIRDIDGKLYNYNYVRNGDGWWSSGSSFIDLGIADRLLLKLDCKPGDEYEATDGYSTFKCLSDDHTVTVPSGKFDHCVLTESQSHHNRCKVAFKDGVGIVWYESYGHVWELKSYDIKGGKGILPLCEGNSWEYVTTDTDGALRNRENKVNVNYSEGGKTVISTSLLMYIAGYEDSWRGCIRAARNEYVTVDAEGKHKLNDAMHYYDKAALMAQTPRQKRHTAVARDVLRTILETDGDINPSRTQEELRNFFSASKLTHENGRVVMSNWNSDTDFECRYNVGEEFEAKKLLYSAFYTILNSNTGALWDDKWCDGYSESRVDYMADCTVKSSFSLHSEDGVTTSAGVFDRCLRLDIVSSGWPYSRIYFGGKMSFWFAPGVGIVKFSRPLNGGQSGVRVENIWELVRYEKTGEGYFPIVDGMLRRYEPVNITGGWHASLEYVFDIEGDSIIAFKNAYGVKDI